MTPSTRFIAIRTVKGQVAQVIFSTAKVAARKRLVAAGSLDLPLFPCLALAIRPAWADYKGCSDYRVKRSMAQTVDEFTIGALSRHTGVKIETIRYYEKSGIMPNPPRSAGGFRMYREEHLNRLRFIRRCRQLGFSMAEIEGLLGLVDDRGYTCGEVHAITLAHADMVRTKIRDLRRLEKTLRSIASQCTGKDVPECPIIDALQDPKDRLAFQQ